MDRIKAFFKEKAYGFYVTVAVALLILVTLITYYVSYNRYVTFMSWWGFAIMIVGLVGACALIALKQGKFAHYLLGLTALLALILFITNIYKYVIVVMVGIDINTFDNKFIACTVLFSLSFVLGVANIFLRQEKKEIK